MEVTRKIRISGLVQGIGFRPFVHQVASRFLLKGQVCNDERGVLILVSGKPQVIDEFYNELLHYPYQLARIRSIKAEPHPLLSFPDFQIVPSPKGRPLNLPFTPDMALCKTCAEELQDPENRRFGYAFTACVACGQRWAVTADFPFEREHTSYKNRSLCKSCQKEYTTLSDRRYHAQTISCPDCGFHCWLESDGQKLPHSGREVFSQAARWLAEGKIIAVKNSAGFLLCCAASDEKAIRELRRRKKRPVKPLAVLFPDLKQVRAHLDCSLVEEQELSGKVSPIVILSLRSNSPAELPMVDLAPGLSQLGVMLPYNGILKLLADAFGAPMVATSGNLHTLPVIADNETALTELKGVADAFLLHDQKIVNPQDDSVVKFSPVNKQRIVFRRSRGMAPNYFDAPFVSDQKYLAMGADLKSTLAVIPNNYLYISQYLGALGGLEVYRRYQGVLDRFVRMFDLKPDVLIADKHPGYQSHQEAKKIAKQFGAELRFIQHHKAHFAAILAEHSLFELQEPVLGVIWDGTGYGDDGAIWGGEFFRYTGREISRLGHLAYFPWLSGDQMAAQPRLSLLAMADDPDQEAQVKARFTHEEWQVYKQLKAKTKLQSSSAGRIFDAVASLLGVGDHNSFEGQAAMQLEALASKAVNEGAEAWEDLVAHGTLDSRDLIKRVGSELENGKSGAVLAMSFLKTLVNLIFKVAAKNKMHHLAFSGGVFQNALLTDLILDEAQEGDRIYFHKELSPNDENIAFGQLMYALNCKPELK